MKKILMLLTLMLTLCMPTSFAVNGVDANDRGGYALILLANSGNYELQDTDYICSYDGIYLAPSVYKKVYGIDITKSGDTWTVAKEGKTYGTFKHNDMYQLDDTTEIEVAYTIDDKSDYLILENIFDIVGDSMYYTWEPVCDPKTDTQEIKLIHTSIDKNFKLNEDVLEFINPTLNKSSVGDLKAVNNYIKKMTKNKAIVNKTNNTITYTDKNGSIIITLNKDTDISVSMTGVLSQTAYDIVGLAYNDVLDKGASKLAVAELKRLNDILTNSKKATELKNIQKRDWVDWYYFAGTTLDLKWSYDYSVVQDKKYIDFTITNFYLNTTSYYE